MIKLNGKYPDVALYEKWADLLSERLSNGGSCLQIAVLLFGDSVTQTLSIPKTC